MTKMILSTFILILSFPVYSCKPGPLPECKGEKVKLEEHKVQELKEGVKSYQELLTQHIIPPEMVTSCFNNRFAFYYVARLEEQLKEKKHACKNQLNRVKSSVERLISDTSAEFKSVKKEEVKKELRKLSKELREKTKTLY